MKRLLAKTFVAALLLAQAAGAATLHVTSEAEEGAGTLGQVILEIKQSDAQPAEPVESA